MKNIYRKFLTILLILAFAITPVFADTSIAINTQIDALDKPATNIISILQKASGLAMIIALIVCGIAWAIPYVLHLENSSQSEKLMQMVIRVLIGIAVVAALVFFPVSIYHAIYNNQVVSGSDFILLANTL